MVNCVLKSGLQDSGKNLVGCGEEGNWPVHFWVCGAAFAFVYFNYSGKFPCLGEFACGEDGVEELDEVLSVLGCEPFEGFSWYVIWSWGFVVLDFG